MSQLSITWFGHSTFRLVSPGGVSIVFDPWLHGNPACPEDSKHIDRADLILVTHGHFDHIDDVVPVARSTGATIVAVYEICAWLETKGLQKLSPMNKGGTQILSGIAISMVHAEHTSGYRDQDRLIYLGEPVGFVLKLEDGMTIYFAGDTGLFGDMRLIADLHAPDVAFLPIGDRFTMGPDEAARACEWLGVRQVVPMHYGTFPLLTGTPARLRELVQPKGIEVIELEPGQTLGGGG